jgi:hypothetical protein
MRQENLRQKKLAKKKLLRKRFEHVRNMFPMKASRKAKIKKVGDKYYAKTRPVYTQMLPESKKFKPSKEIREKSKQIAKSLKKIGDHHYSVTQGAVENGKLDKDAG